MARVKVLSNFPPRPCLRPPAASCCSGDQEHVRGSKLSDYYDENCGALKISKFVKKLFNLNFFLLRVGKPFKWIHAVY